MKPRLHLTVRMSVARMTNSRMAPLSLPAVATPLRTAPLLFAQAATHTHAFQRPITTMQQPTLAVALHTVRTQHTRTLYTYAQASAHVHMRAAPSAHAATPMPLIWTSGTSISARQRRRIHRCTLRCEHTTSMTQQATTVTVEQTQQQQQQQQQQSSSRDERRESDSESDSRRSSSSSSSTRSSSFNPFRSFVRLCRLAFEWYSGKLDRYPVRTQALTSGFLFLIGDATAQRWEEQLDREAGIDTSNRPLFDLRRMMACVSFGLFVLGPCGHFWYSRLDVFTNRMFAPRTWSNVAMKVLLDTAIFNPIFLIVFFSMVSLMEGLTLDDIRRKLYRDFVPSYAIDCSVWPPIQTLNFKFIPVKFQLLIVNLGCYFDDVFLSYVQHNGMPWIFRAVEQWWLEYIGAEEAEQGAAREAKPITEGGEPQMIVEVLPSKQQAILVPASSHHPRQPHVHPPSSASATTPSPHHHLIPRVLAETENKLPRARGIDVQVVEELDRDWTEVKSVPVADKERGKNNQK